MASITLDDGRILPIKHAGSPLHTNASLNRRAAGKVAAAGGTAADVANAWPEVFGVNADGKLFTKYDYALSDGSGRYECNRLITGKSLADVLRRVRARRKGTAQ